MRRAAVIFFIVFLASALFLMADDWKNIKSSHFIIYYKKTDIKFIDNLKDNLENYYQKITEEIGFTRYNNFWIWENRAKIYVYDTKKDYIMATNQPDWSLGVANAKDKIISTYYNVKDREFFDKIILHELAHLIFREFVGFSSNVPIWLDEGVASFFSKDYSFIKPAIQQILKDNKYILLNNLPVKSIGGLNDDQIKIFYLESVAVIYYLMSNFNKSNFVGFCRSLRDGNSLDRALYSNYSIKDIDELNKRVVKYFNE